MVMSNVAFIRMDLLKAELGVPIGNEYYFESKPLKYRWLSDVDFQVLFKNKWQNAESIDWDFMKKLI